MAVSMIFVAALVALAAKDGVHSCALRSHKPCSSTCSSPVPDSTPIPYRTPASLHGSSFGKYPDTLNKAPSISPDSYSFPRQTPAVPKPLPIMPISIPSDSNQILLNLLLKQLLAASTPVTTTPVPLPLPSLPPPYSFYGSAPSLPLTPAPYQTVDFNSDDLTQLLSLLLSAGSGSSLPSTPATIAAPSSVPVPSVTRTTVPIDVPITVPATTPIVVPSAVPETATVHHVPSAIPETAPTNVPNTIPETSSTDAPSTVPEISPISVPGTTPGSYPSITPATDMAALAFFTNTYSGVVPDSVPTWGGSAQNITTDYSNTSTESITASDSITTSDSVTTSSSIITSTNLPQQ